MQLIEADPEKKEERNFGQEKKNQAKENRCLLE